MKYYSKKSISNTFNNNTRKTNYINVHMFLDSLF